MDSSLSSTREVSLMGVFRFFQCVEQQPIISLLRVDVDVFIPGRNISGLLDHMKHDGLR
jgi:hypothetical protein